MLRPCHNNGLPRLFLLGALGMLLAVAACAPSTTRTISQHQPATALDIRLTTDHNAYTIHMPIGITLTNVGQATYYALDGRSRCTLVQLQVLDASHNTWAPTSGCAGGSQPHSLAIPAGISEPFTLAPGSSADPNAWQPGTYRVAAAVSSNPDGNSALSIAASAAFVIHS